MLAQVRMLKFIRCGTRAISILLPFHLLRPFVLSCKRFDTSYRSLTSPKSKKWPPVYLKWLFLSRVFKNSKPCFQRSRGDFHLIFQIHRNAYHDWSPFCLKLWFHWHVRDTKAFWNTRMEWELNIGGKSDFLRVIATFLTYKSWWIQLVQVFVGGL